MHKFVYCFHFQNCNDQNENDAHHNRAHERGQYIIGKCCGFSVKANTNSRMAITPSARKSNKIRPLNGYGWITKFGQRPTVGKFCRVFWKVFIFCRPISQQTIFIDFTQPYINLNWLKQNPQRMWITKNGVVRSHANCCDNFHGNLDTWRSCFSISINNNRELNQMKHLPNVDRKNNLLHRAGPQKNTKKWKIKQGRRDQKFQEIFQCENLAGVMKFLHLSDPKTQQNSC